MINDLSDDQLAIVTELVIHHGMYRVKKDDYKYDIYYRIAGELIEELKERNYRPNWVKALTDEFVHSQLYVDPLNGGD